MPRERKPFTAEEKVSILRRHLLDKVPVSTICEETGIQPPLFYRAAGGDGWRCVFRFLIGRAACLCWFCEPGLASLV